MALTTDQFQQVVADIALQLLRSVRAVEVWWALDRRDYGADADAAWIDITEAIRTAQIDITWPDRPAHDGSPAAATAGDPKTHHPQEVDPLD